MTDWATVVVDLVEAAARDVTVFDGQPAAKLEDRPPVHVILDVDVPTLMDDTITSTRDAALVAFQVRVIVRSGQTIAEEDAAWVARWHAHKIRDFLVRRRLRPGGQLIDHVMQTSMVDDQAMVSHSTRIQVSQFEAKV